MLVPAWLKRIVKRSRFLVWVYSKFSWKLHLLQDWWGTKVWTRTDVVDTPLGFKLHSGLHPAYALMRRGEFEVLETALVIDCLTRCDRFVDIGANLGYYTCIALSRGKPTLAIEPQPQNLRCLYRNLITNGWQDRAEVLPVALSEHTGLLPLYGASGPSASLVKDWAGYSSRHVQLVPVTTLDNVLDGRFHGERLLIKLDVEGAEYALLKGSLRTLNRAPSPIWLLEICLQEFHPDGANPHYLETFNLFWRAGYRSYVVEESLREVTGDLAELWWEQRHSGTSSFNYLFIGADMEPPHAARPKS